MENERIYTVYMHTCIVNEKKYIGITKQTLKKRWDSGHGYSNCRCFNFAIKKYGKNNFKHEIILQNLTKQEAEMFEVEMIKYYKTQDRKYGYNLANGGSTPTFSEETRKKMSLSHVGKKLPQETKDKISKANKGKFVSQDTRIKISAINKGRKMTKETNEKNRQAKLGTTLSQETKDKISKAMKGKIKSLETRIKLSIANTGKVATQETRDKISKARKGKKVSDIAKENITNANRKRTCRAVKNITTEKTFKGIVDAALFYNINKSSISRACSGKNKTAGGFEWKYI